jgi:putative endonuclease
MGPRHKAWGDDEGLTEALRNRMTSDGLIAVYMMASRRYGTIYIGVASDLARRAWEHREGLIPGFTKRYGCKRLVWYEPHESIVVAIQREKSMKRWPRDWKTNLIERENPHWTDLYDTLNR